jgi:peptide deformylase
MATTKLKIHVWPDPILRKKCRLVSTVDDDIRKQLEQMRLLMHSQNGIGLAANQAGLDASMIVCEIKGACIKLINPTIVKASGMVRFKEGCLSFPGIEIDVRRFAKILVKAKNEFGQDVEFEVDDVLAIILQHEIDHINGIPFIFRVPFWKRLKLAAKLAAIKFKTK